MNLWERKTKENLQHIVKGVYELWSGGGGGGDGGDGGDSGGGGDSEGGGQFQTF